MTAVNNTGSFQSEHEVVLQGLSQWLPGPSKIGKVFYGVDNFAPTADAWNKIPILFCPPGIKPVHPDHAALARDPIGTAKVYGYRIIGNPKNTRVTGSQIVADALLSDPQAAELAKNNKLGLSTGFDAQIDNAGRINGRVDPNHILVFMSCKKAAAGEHCGTGNDPRAAFNNIAPVERPPMPRHGSKDLSEMEAEQQRARDVRNGRPLESAHEIPEFFREQAREREAAAVEMIKARGKIDPATGMFRDFQSCEEPD
ncbi:hypothetical protein [Methanoregula sp.]|uniref:hypothetical protein n=1 Tax=Methanoregula sp. TaxID=2052170 RepID=UPI000CAAB268|nr:hypothetical protein [Methanoregula sp.]PKG32916.1 MAG: hypothetical protein CW742_05680 [Methanoregula sp.]